MSNLRKFPRERYDTAELVKASGLTPRQIDYMIRTGALKPIKDHPGSGHLRLFEEKEREIAAILGMMRKLSKKYLVMNAVTVAQIAEQLRKQNTTHPSIDRIYFDFSSHELVIILLPTGYKTLTIQITL